VALTGLDPDTAVREARRIAEELAAAVSGRVELRGREVEVRASVGVAVYPVDGEDFDALLHSADLDVSLRRSDAPH
jgi:GGDEF domain-containing protein